MCPQARMCSPKESNRTDTVGVLCDKDLFLLFLVSTPECEGEIRTKGGFCAHKRECVPQAKIVPQKKTTGPMPLRCIFKEDFCSFFGLPPNVRAKSASKKAFVPHARMRPKAKIVLQKKVTGPTPLRCICDKDLFCLHSQIYFFAPPKFSMPPSFPAHYSGAGSASMNRSEIRLKIVFWTITISHLFQPFV